jgi:RNA-directed DNA polymerase
MNILEHEQTCSWNTINWKLIQIQVFKWQRRIYTASKYNDIKKVRYLQNIILKSRSAKLLAIRKITQDNQGRKTAGVDGISHLPPKQRLLLADNLNFPTKSKPLRRVWIPKTGSLDKRPLGIPTIKDRCLQALFKIALEPEWEAKFEPNSYGFRPGRNPHDAIVAIQSCIQKRYKFVLDADIAKCFDRINHNALLDKIGFKGKYRKQLQYWLEAGVLDAEIFEPTEQGTPPFARSATFASSAKAKEAREGGVISPLLANIALHGLENHLKHCFMDIPVYYSSGNKVRPSRAYETLHVIRYADDFVILHDNFDVILRCKDETRKFLSSMGLELSEAKTRITHTLELNNVDSKLRHFDGMFGFNFLGFTIKQFKSIHKSAYNQGSKLGYKTLIYPSKVSINKHQKKLHNIILKKGKGLDQKTLIKSLNPIIRGWASYFGVSNAMTTGHLNKQDYLLYLKLRKWCSRIKGTTGKASNNWSGSTRNKWTFGQLGQKRLVKHTDYSLPIGKMGYIKVKSEGSPFDENVDYWSKRLSISPRFTTRVKALMKKQKAFCKWCHLRFVDDDTLEIDHIQPLKSGGKDEWNNLQLLHRHCHDNKTASDIKIIKNSNQ